MSSRIITSGCIAFLVLSIVSSCAKDSTSAALPCEAAGFLEEARARLDRGEAMRLESDGYSATFASSLRHFQETRGDETISVVEDLTVYEDVRGVKGFSRMAVFDPSGPRKYFNELSLATAVLCKYYTISVSRNTNAVIISYSLTEDQRKNLPEQLIPSDLAFQKEAGKGTYTFGVPDPLEDFSFEGVCLRSSGVANNSTNLPVCPEQNVVVDPNVGLPTSAGQ